MNNETQELNDSSTIDFNLNDLTTLKNIIDVASARGAIKPSEMSIVGATYNKLVTFLAQANTSAKLQQNKEETSQ